MMSNSVNDALLEEADFYIEYFTGTTMEKVLRQDIRAHDLESLTHHIKDARAIEFELEYNPEGANHESR